MWAPSARMFTGWTVETYLITETGSLWSNTAGAYLWAAAVSILDTRTETWWMLLCSSLWKNQLLGFPPAACLGAVISPRLFPSLSSRCQSSADPLRHRTPRRSFSALPCPKAAWPKKEEWLSNRVRCEQKQRTLSLWHQRKNSVCVHISFRWRMKAGEDEERDEGEERRRGEETRIRP